MIDSKEFVKWRHPWSETSVHSRFENYSISFEGERRQVQWWIAYLRFRDAGIHVGHQKAVRYFRADAYGQRRSLCRPRSTSKYQEDFSFLVALQKEGSPEFDDMIAGNGEGLIILLQGAPCVGKTKHLLQVSQLNQLSLRRLLRTAHIREHRGLFQTAALHTGQTKLWLLCSQFM